MKKLLLQLFGKKRKAPHQHSWYTYMTTGQGTIETGTRALVQRCDCGAEQVIHKGGTFQIKPGNSLV